jgi:hypothetical protein
VEGTAEAAFVEAMHNRPEPGEVAGVDAQDLRSGMEVEVLPDDTLRGAVRGRVVATGPSEIAIERSHPRCGTVVVHFPRLGYRVRPID